jgi:hypothetical protein
VSAAGAGEPWKLSLDANLSGTFNAYSDNWVGGERGSLSWSTQWLAVAEKQLGFAVDTKNTLKLAFGQTKAQDKLSNHWLAPQKSADLIDLESLWRLTFGTQVDPYVSVRGISEFLDMSDTRSDPYYPYINPIDLTESVGAIRDLVKKERLTWNARLGAAAHELINRWEPDSNYRTITTSDGGAELVTELATSMKQDVVKLRTTLKVYEALVRDGSDKIPDWWRYPDINWENTLTINVVKYVMISYSLQLLYDREIDANARVKQNLGLGLAYCGKRPKEEKK